MTEAPEPLGPGVEAEGAGEEAVVEGDLHHVVAGDAAGDQGAGGAARPSVRRSLRV